MDHLAGKVAVITGGASGIGLAMAHAFGAAGLKLVLGDIEQAALDRAVPELAARGFQVVGVRTDVARFADVEALAQAALAAFGKIHVAVNNAGVPWLTASGQTSAATVGAVAGALTLSRIPTMFAGAAFGPVLAPLAAAVDARERLAFHAVHRRAAAAAWGLSAAFTLVFTVAGPFLLSRYLGPGFRLPRPELAAMAAGSGLMLLCGVEQAALVALSAWTWSAIGWAVGLASFGLVLVLPIDPPLRLACAVLVAPLVAVLVMSAARRSAQRSGRVFQG